MNGGHEEALGNVVKISGISHCWPLGTPAVIFREGGKVLVIQFTLPSIQACIVGRSSVEVARFEIPSLRSQEIAYSVNELGTRSMPRREVNKRTVTILVVVVLFLLVIADFGLKVDETAD